MYIKALLFIVVAAMLVFVGCARKQLPQESNNATKVPLDTLAIAKVTKPLPAKTILKKIPTPTPTVIVVNDEVARKSVDGRLYYDLEGHRYWKNYDDGKYYIFNKSMYTNKAFKPH